MMPIKNIFSNYRLKLSFLIICITGLISLFVFLYFPNLIQELAYDNIIQKVKTITRSSAVSAASGVYFKDKNSVEEIITPILIERNISFVIVNDKDSKLLYSFNLSDAVENEYNKITSEYLLSDELLIMKSDIIMYDEIIGKIYIGYSLSELNVNLENLKLKIIYFSLGIILIGVIIAFVLGKVITKPLESVVQTVNEISNGDLTKRAPVYTKDEIGYLAESFNEMVEKLIAASRKYEKRNLELQEEIKIREKYENDLKESESRVRSIFQNASLGIFEICEKGEFVIVNDALLKMLNYDNQEELIGKNIAESFTSDENKNKFIKKIFNNETIRGYETEWVNKNGNPLYMRISLNRLTNINEEKQYFVGTVEDITEKRNFFLELEKNEYKYRTLFNLSPVGIIVAKPDWTILDVNNAFCNGVGYSSEELIGNSLNIFTDPENVPDIQKNIERILNGEILNHTVKNISKDGKIVYLELYESRIALADGTNGILSLVNNITEKVVYQNELVIAKEKAEQSNKLKSEFLAQMSHEIRTPVNTILSFISLIKEDISQYMNDDIKSSFLMIEGGGNRLIRTIDLILDMSQLQAGTFDVAKREVELIDFIIKPLIAEYSIKAKNKGLKFEFIEKLLTKPIVHIDVYIFSQMLINLIDNAIKYTEQGEVNLILYCNESKNICIDIRDTGIGMSQDFMKNLFIPFSQEEQGYTRRYEGNGLGLSLVKKYCELLNCEIQVKSEKNIGTVFTITLPEKN